MVHYRKFLEIEPENVEARNILGTALIQQGRGSDCAAHAGGMHWSRCAKARVERIR
jgi:hypothetical protein